MPGYHYFDYLTQDIDPEFLEWAYAVHSSTSVFHDAGINLADIENMPFTLSIGGTLITAIWHSGTPPAANLHASELGRLTATVPQLKPMMAGASWIGGRRWDIRFQSGELLALPEGEEAAAKALAHFAKIDQNTQLLGRGFVRFDMRVPGKFIVRVSREPGSSVPAIAPETAPGDAAPAAGAGDIDPAKTI